MGDIGRVTFSDPEAVELGAAPRTACASSSSRYSVPEADTRLGRLPWPGFGSETELAEVGIVGTDRVNPEYVRAQLESAPGAIMTAEAIAEDTERVYALGDFEGVDYDPHRAGRRARARDLAGGEGLGPELLPLRSRHGRVRGGDMFAILRLDHDRTWMNSRGARWHNAMQLGRSRCGFDFFQPLDVRSDSSCNRSLSSHEKSKTSTRTGPRHAL